VLGALNLWISRSMRIWWKVVDGRGIRNLYQIRCSSERVNWFWGCKATHASTATSSSTPATVTTGAAWPLRRTVWRRSSEIPDPVRLAPTGLNSIYLGWRVGMLRVKRLTRLWLWVKPREGLCICWETCQQPCSLKCRENVFWSKYPNVQWILSYSASIWARLPSPICYW